MSTFWQELDNYLLNQASDLSGVAFAGADGTINIDTAPLPAVLVRGLEVELSPGAHGDGVVHREAAYAYTVAAFVRENSLAAAKAAAQLFVPGLENMMYAAGIFTVVGDDGERAIQVEPGNAYIELRLQRAGVNEIYLGIAAVTFTVTAER